MGHPSNLVGHPLIQWEALYPRRAKYTRVPCVHIGCHMTRIGLKLLGIALLLGAGITFTFYSTSAWLHARDFSRFDFGNEQRRKKLRTEFEALTTTVKETLDKFGVNFLAKQAALRESYSNKGKLLFNVHTVIVWYLLYSYCWRCQHNLSQIIFDQ